MKKVIYFMVAVFLISATPMIVHANKDKKSMSIAEKVTGKMEKLTSQLELTKDQIKPVQDLLTVKLKKRQAIQKERAKKVKAVRKNYSKQLRSVLTDAQWVKYEEMQKEWKNKNKKGSNHGTKGSSME